MITCGLDWFGLAAIFAEPNSRGDFGMSEYLDDVKRYAAKADENAVAGIVKHLGIALKSKDSSLVSCSSKDEFGARAG